MQVKLDACSSPGVRACFFSQWPFRYLYHHFQAIQNDQLKKLAHKAGSWPGEWGALTGLGQWQAGSVENYNPDLRNKQQST